MTFETFIKEEKSRLVNYAILLAVIFFLLLINYLFIKPLVSLPAPLYGGDYYFQLSQTNHVKYGGSPLTSSNIVGGLPSYFVIYSAFTGWIARIFSINAIQAEFSFTYIIIILSAIVMFFLSLKLFKNPLISAIAVLYLIAVAGFPIVKYTILVELLLIPLLFLCIYNFINKKSLINAIILGIAYGMVGLGHAVAFMASSVLMAFVFIYFEILANPDLKIKKIKETKKIDFKKLFCSVWPYLVVLVVALPLILLWWFKPIFVYHGQTSLHQIDANNTDWSQASIQFGFVFDTLKAAFFNFTNIYTIIFSLLGIAGLLALFFLKTRNSQIRFVKFIIVSAFILVFHYFITQNLLGFNLVSEYISYLILEPAKVLLLCLGAYFIYNLLKKLVFKTDNNDGNNTRNTIVKYAFFGTIIILVLVWQVNSYNHRTDNRWYGAGYSELPPNMKELSTYLVANTNVYDTILTSKELGFALNSLSGRKLVITRRAHTDPFIDLDSREIDTAIVLYGNGSAPRKEIIQKYNIKYLYWDNYWIQSEFQINEQGQITGWFDPLVMFDSPEKQETLKAYNVSFFTQNTWIDPAVKGEHIKKFDLLFISPQNYNSFEHPWDNELDSYLQEVWNYTQSGVVVSRLYKIVNI
jgi:hypothetical protein